MQVNEQRAYDRQVEIGRVSFRQAEAVMARARKSRAAKSTRASWVRRVRETSNAMDLDDQVFNRSPKEIASSLARSARRSKRTKGTKFQSAMSMLNYYINRAGRKLPPSKRARLERAKVELRRAFGRDLPPTGARKKKNAPRRRR
jgi:hypothetical protein